MVRGIGMEVKGDSGGTGTISKQVGQQDQGCWSGHFTPAHPKVGDWFQGDNGRKSDGQERWHGYPPSDSRRFGLPARSIPHRNRSQVNLREAFLIPEPNRQ